MSAENPWQLELSPGYRSPTAALFVAALDDQSRRLTEELGDAPQEELCWAPGPGQNSMGMLFAHMAIVEAYWTLLALGRVDRPDVRTVIGIGEDDDGMPLALDAPPFALLHGKTFTTFEDLHAKARAHLKELATDVPEEDLSREIRRRRPDGSERVFNVRWYFYHLLEHFAHHRGQAVLLRHLYRARSEGEAR